MSEADDNQYYEIEIDGRIVRISRSRIDDLADQLLGGGASLPDKLREAFAQHPHVDTEAEEDQPPIGNEPEPSDD